LTERAAELAVQMNDRGALRRLRGVIDRQDRGRNLRSYRMARSTLDVADALVQGDYQRAAALSARDQLELYHARSIATVLLLRAQALAGTGQLSAARSLYQQLAHQRDFVDIDAEVRALVAHIASRRLTSLP
jgi:hypothetical protein